LIKHYAPFFAGKMEPDGRTDQLGAADTQYICAGRGTIHAKQSQGGRHGLQLWTALLPAKN
jgi:redox-sensitive bicupin YhaK (pirin superfamily)